MYFSFCIFFYLHIIIYTQVYIYTIYSLGHANTMKNEGFKPPIYGSWLQKWRLRVPMVYSRIILQYAFEALWACVKAYCTQIYLFFVETQTAT